MVDGVVNDGVASCIQIEREANVIAKETRRGKGNFIVCSADVASALAMSGMLTMQNWW